MSHTLAVFFTDENEAQFLDCDVLAADPDDTELMPMAKDACAWMSHGLFHKVLARVESKNTSEVITPKMQAVQCQQAGLVDLAMLKHKGVMGQMELHDQ